MKIPNEDTAKRYFARLGYTLERGPALPDRTPHWHLIGNNGSRSIYDSLQALWEEWIEGAKQAINEDDTFQAFRHEYECADATRRSELRDWINLYWEDPFSDEVIAETFTSGWGNYSSDLPKDWRRRLHEIITIPANSEIFVVRALRYVERCPK